MIKIILNKDKVHNYKKEQNKIYIDSVEADVNLIKVSSREYFLLKDNKTFRVEVLETDFSKKELVFRVNNKKVLINLKDDKDILLEKLGIEAKKAGTASEVKAPMPGLILQVMVKPGDSIKPGDSLFVLEAMKMENVIKAQGEGVVKQVLVKESDKVEKNQLIVKFQ